MSSDPAAPHSPWTRVRAIVNWVNLSTPLGLLIARTGGARIVPLGRGVYVASGYRYRFPVAGAFTVGSVIVSRHGEAWLRARPLLLRHEERHCTQYAFLVGPVMLPLYALGAGLSYVIAGDHSSFNPFERLAGLADGRYPPARTRRAKRRTRMR